MHKIAFQLGPLPVHWYGVLVALGFLAGLWTASRRGVRDGLAPESIMDAGVWLILGTLVGARALYVLTYWQESFAQQPWTEIFMLQHGGLVFYGGLIGATVAALIYLRWKKLPFWKFTDALAPSVALGYVFGRIGCLMNGCCYGRLTNMPWAIHFPKDHETWGQPVHPTQIYDSLLSLGLYAWLARFYRLKEFDGQIFATYLMCYAVQRAFVELFRGDYSVAHLHGGFTPAQMVSVATFTAGLLLYWKLPRSARVTLPAHVEIHTPVSFRQPLLLTGPTAVGKSEVALELAGRLGGEIISVDSMQVYRGLDLGTAKPSPDVRQRVPHHLIDVVELTEPFDAAQFARLATAAVREIQARGRLPILCGGTGLYFEAFLEGLGGAPAPDLTLRSELEKIPLAELLRELEKTDPDTFQKIDRQNPRRVIRAVEVIRLTGRPFSTQRAAWTPGASTFAVGGSPFHFGLARAPDDLRARIDARVEEMFRRGLVAETEQLLQRGLAANRTAMQAIGYREVVEHLRGQRSLAQTVELVKIRTRQFAKHQLTWFRQHGNLTWVNAAPQESPTALVTRIAEAFVRPAPDREGAAQ